VLSVVTTVPALFSLSSLSAPDFAFSFSLFRLIQTTQHCSQRSQTDTIKHTSVSYQPALNILLNCMIMGHVIF